MGRTRHRGFTLIEAMATVVVLGTLATFSTVTLVDTVDSYQKAAMQAQLHAELATALDRVARETRRIGLDPDEPGSKPHITAFTNTTQILWEDDSNASWGLILAGDDLSLRVTGTSYQILDDVSSLTLTAYDEDDTQLGAVLVGAQLNPIRRLAVDVTMTRDGVSQSLQTKVFLREFVEGGG
jgi:prepilin-type N-terminal cleavage/methylation domain-containing protein